MTDTIVALSSGAPPSGVAVIRISGPVTRELIAPAPPPRVMALRTIAGIDRGLVVFFPAPHSFTGEDCAELQVHGSPVVVRALLRALTSRGARLAEPGEFTRRAFENGKLDLTEVEGLGDLLAAQTEGQRRQAVARLTGGVATRLARWRLALLDLRAEIEANLDFSDEDDVHGMPMSFGGSVLSLKTELEEALASVEGGRIVREGLRVAIAGPPNVGKSSLINALAKADVAIVTDEPGTTRDVREVPLDLDGQLVVLVDMAGLRETTSKAEAEGVRRANEEIANADIVLWLEAPDVDKMDAPAHGNIIRVATKADVGDIGGLDLSISTRSGAGLNDLLTLISTEAAQLRGDGGSPILSRERDRAALLTAIEGLELAHSAVDLEVRAEGLRAASHALERLLGKMDAEAVLDRLFHSFCIGK